MKKYLKSLIGFPFGNLMLAISYILIYVVDGNEVFTNEISKLMEFKFFLGQFIFSGLYCVIVFATIQYIMNLFNIDLRETTVKNIWFGAVKFIIALVMGFGVCKGISLILNRRGALKVYSGQIYTKTLVLLMIVLSIAYVVYQEIQNKKINDALKEKQRS